MQLHPETISDPGAPIPGRLPAGAPPSSPISRRTQAGLPRHSKPAMRSESAADHDTTLLVAALQDLESRRAAIEWLLEAGLLGQCLV